jgi:hypothetical protein
MSCVHIFDASLTYRRRAVRRTQRCRRERRTVSIQPVRCCHAARPIPSTASTATSAAAAVPSDTPGRPATTAAILLPVNRPGSHTTTTATTTATATARTPCRTPTYSAAIWTPINRFSCQRPRRSSTRLQFTITSTIWRTYQQRETRSQR